MTPQTPAIARKRSAEFYKAFSASHRASIGDGPVAVTSTFQPFRPGLALATVATVPGAALVVRQELDGSVRVIGQILPPVNSFDLMDANPNPAGDFSRQAAAVPAPPNPQAVPPLVTVRGVGVSEPSPVIAANS